MVFHLLRFYPFISQLGTQAFDKEIKTVPKAFYIISRQSCIDLKANQLTEQLFLTYIKVIFK